MTMFKTTSFQPIDRTAAGWPLTPGSAPRAASIPVAAPDDPRAQPMIAACHPDERLSQALRATQRGMRLWSLSADVQSLRPLLWRLAPAGGPATFWLALTDVVSTVLEAYASVMDETAQAIWDEQVAGCREYRKVVRSGFHAPSCTQHVGEPVERTTSEYLDVLDHLRENTKAASLKGTLEFVRRGATSHPQAIAGVSSRQALERYHRPDPSSFRFVPDLLKGNEAAFDDMSAQAEPDSPAEQLEHLGTLDTYDAHRERLIQWALTSRGKSSLDEFDKADWDITQLSQALGELKMAGAARRVLVRGGRARLQPIVKVSETSSRSFMVDAEEEALEVHRNELPSEWDLVGKIRVLRNAMRQQAEEAHREMPDSDEFDAGSGIRKAHTHPHLGLSKEELDAQREWEQYERGEVAVAMLDAMRHEPSYSSDMPTFTSEPCSGWFKNVRRRLRPWFALSGDVTVTRPDGTVEVEKGKDVVIRWRTVVESVSWEQRGLDDRVLFGTREESTPYIDERGSADGVWVEEQAEDAYLESIAW